jgi:hypothetical protein
MELSIDGYVTDTILFQDSITFIDDDTSTGYWPIDMESIVQTDNSLSWTDTIWLGSDFRKRYYASDNWFLLYVTNSTNRTMNSVVVESSYPSQYDSSWVYVPVDQSSDIGYYRPSAATDFRCYFVGTTEFIYWTDPVDTRSIDGEAALIPREPSLYLPKTATGSDGLKVCPQRPKRVYDFGQYLVDKGLK